MIGLAQQPARSRHSATPPPGNIQVKKMFFLFNSGVGVGPGQGHQRLQAGGGGGGEGRPGHTDREGYLPTEVTESPLHPIYVIWFIFEI